MTDLRPTITPKSDQLNADDLLGGPRTIEVTKVALRETADQPIAVHFVGDGGKPYLPCKSMRRVMVHVWGSDGNKFIGRRMTLYCDPKVQFGGQAVGGIRISHMSDIEREVTMALTATRAQRRPFTVKPLPTVETARQASQSTAPLGERAGACRERLTQASNITKLDSIWAAARQLRTDLEEAQSDLLPDLERHYHDCRERLAQPSGGEFDDDGFPGDR